jgi:hypothetical protein
MSPAPASALLPELAELLLARGTRVRMAVGGRSMAPRLRDNDIVTIEPLTGTSVHFGELVLFRNAGGALVLHRVLRRWRGHLQTGGDASIRLDRAVARERVLGRVCRIEKEDGSRIELERARERLRAIVIGVAKVVSSGVFYKINRFFAGRIREQARSYSG